MKNKIGTNTRYYYDYFIALPEYSDRANGII